jgi:hypothetical protein
VTTNLANIIIFIYAIHAILQYWRTAIGSRVRTKLKLQPARFTVYILFLITIVALSSVFIFSNPAVTGRFFAPLEDFSLQVDNTFTSNQNYELQIAQDFPYNLKSLKISGSFTGESAKVYLINGSEKYLVSELKGTTQEESSGLVTGALTKAGEIGNKFKDKDKSAKKDKDSSSSDSSSSSSGESSSAQPESPSSSDSTNTGSSDTEPSSDSGAETSAPAEQTPSEQTPEEIQPVETPPAEIPPVEEVPEEIPAEEVPEENQTVEIPEENVTLPEENITVPEENTTLPENITNETLPENTTNITVPVEQTFTDECVDTCLLPDGLDADSYKLEIEVTNGELAIDEISYSLLNLTEVPVTVNITIVDSKGQPVAADIALVNDSGAPVPEETSVAEKIAPPTTAENADTFEVKPSDQNNLAVDITTSEVPVKAIEFQNIDATKDVNAVIGVDNVPETAVPEVNGAQVTEVYAIDPTQLNFTEATVTVEAKGVALYKCANWDFDQQVCNGEWTFLQAITPGQDYSIALTANDPAFSETQQPNGAGKDTYINELLTNENNGANDVLKVKTSVQDNKILLEFNLSNIPSNAIITSASVTLYGEAGTNNGEENVSIYRVTRYWDEGTGNAQSSGDGATWNNATNTTLWTTAGGDYAATEFARTPVTTNGYYTWIITSLVQGWVNGTWSNYGFIMVNPIDGDSLNTFTSGDDTVAVQRPQFNVSYTTALNVTFVSPTPANSATLNQSWVYVNATLANGNASAAKLDWNGTNYTMSGSGTNWYLNKTNLSSGTYTYKVYANDSGTNVFDVSETRTVTLNTDQTPPIITIINPANTTYNTKSNLPLNYAATDNVAVDKCWVSYDGGPNSTLAGCANSTFSVSNDGSHYVKVFANDTSSNQNSSTRYFTVDSTPPQWSSQQSSIPSAYSASTVSIFNITWTDAVSGVNTVLFESNYSGTPQNYSTYVISGNVYGYNATLPAGTFYWKFHAKDSVNNWNASSQQVATINKADNPVSLYINGNLNQNVTITYGTQSNVTGIVVAGTANLYRDGIAVSNPEITTLAAGIYNYTAVIPETENTTGSFKTFFVTVSKAMPTLTITNSTPLDVTYGTQTNVSCSADTYQVTAQLFGDGVLVSSPDVQTFAVGTYNYTCNNAETQNYTATSATPLVVTVSKAPTSTQLYLNGARANKTVTYGAQSNATAVTSAGSVILYRDSVAISNTEIATLAAGTYNYTAVNEGNENYSALSETWFLAVNKQLTTTNLFLNGAQNNLTITYGTQTNVTAVGYNSTVSLYKDGILISNPEITILASGTYNYTAIISEDQNRTGSSKTFFLTVNKAAPSIDLTVNGHDHDLAVSVGDLVNVSVELVTPAGIGAVELFEDGVLNTTTSTSAVVQASYAATGERNWTAQYNATQNYTSASITRILSVVDVGAPHYMHIEETPADPATYSPVQTYEFDANWTDDTGISDVILEFAGVNYSLSAGQLNKSGDEYSKTVSSLAAGLYSYRWRANDTSNNWGSTPTESYAVDKAPASLLLNLEPSNVVTYIAQTNASCIADNVESSPVLTRDSIAVSNPDAQTLAAGTYDYACTAAATQNYTAGSSANTLIINRATTALVLSITPSIVTYPAITTASCSANNGEVSVQFFRNGIGVSSPDTGELAAGTYDYICNNTETQNYTSASTTGTLTVNKANSVVGLLLNGQDSGITVNKGATVNISATLTTPNSGDLSLTQNSIQINYGASPLSNSTTYNTAGTYTIEAGFAGDENYTDSSESHAITVQTSGGVGGGGGGSGNYNPPQNNTPPVLSAYPQPLPITVKVSENQETENKTSDEKERTSGITGAATEVRAYKIPNPAYAVPTLLLLVLIFAILSLKKTDISEKAKKVLTALHAALITAVIALLFFTFVKAPAITGGAVTVGAVHINLTQENLLIIIPLALIIASGTALYYINEKYGVNRKNKKSK